MTASERIERIQQLVKAEGDGDESAHHALLREIRELQQVVETPIETTSRINFQMLQNICLRIAIERGLLQTIAAKHGSIITARELHEQTGTDALLIARIFRVLTAIGLVSETAPETYASNRVTQHAITPGAIGALKHHFDLDMAHGGRLVDYMRRAEDDGTIHQFAGEPKGNTTLFEYTHGHPTIFGLLAEESEKGREQKEAFDAYMASKRPAGTRMQQWFDIFPAGEKLVDAKEGEGEVLMVDVGGGPGQELVGLKKQCPQLPGRFILQDLPITLDRIESLPDGVEKMPYDFFTPQPIIGARVYFLRDIMHNWSDANCTLILRNLAAAMQRDYSTLLIDQYVLPSRDVDLRAAEMDILMMLHTSGIQRTVSMWEALFEGAGLRLGRVWESRTGMESVLEVEKA